MLLSICIPTYNRAEYLREALENITSDPAFDDRVEVVISDNASPDHTREVGEEFADRFPNVRYFRNERNLVDENFEIVLRHGRGKYLKLFNDTLRLRPHSLAKILAIIEKSSDTEPIYFYNANDEFHYQHRECADKEDFLDASTFWITSIGGFGLWKKDIDIVSNSKQYSYLQFCQVVWSLRLADSKEKSHIYTGDWFSSNQPKNKGGYNIFETFTDKYFKTLRICGIDGAALRKEKHRHFSGFLMYWIDVFLVHDSGTHFDISNGWKYLLKHYWYCPYFYTLLLKRYGKGALKKCLMRK